MGNYFIDEFDVHCTGCETKFTLSYNNACEIANSGFQCPVCKTDLTAYTSEAISIIHSCNMEIEKLKRCLKDNEVISISECECDCDFD